MNNKHSSSNFFSAGGVDLFGVLFALAVLIFVSEPVLAKAEKTKPKTTCSTKQLQLKSCYLTLGANRIHIWNDKIFLNDLIQRDVQPIDTIVQDQSKVVEWQFAKAVQLNERWFIELGLWGPPLSEGAIESLWWVVYEIREGRLVKQLEKLIQKRKKVSDGKLKYDKRAKFELQAQKKQVQWSINSEQGILK